MSWTRHLARFSILGVALGGLSACTLTGVWGDSNGDWKWQGSSSGPVRWDNGALQVAYLVPPVPTTIPAKAPDVGVARWVSQGGSAKFRKSGRGAVRFVNADRHYHTAVTTSQLGTNVANGQCPWPKSVCSIDIANVNTQRPADLGVAITTDTGGPGGAPDGYVSGNVSGPCQLLGGLAYVSNVNPGGSNPNGPAMPTPSAFGDTTACPKGGLAPFTSAITEYPTIAWAVGTEMDPTGHNSLPFLAKLPVDIQVDFFNSLDASHIRTSPSGDQLMKVELTGIEVNGRRYSPTGTYLEFHNMAPITLFDPRTQSAGWKLVAGWLAEQFERALDRRENISVTVEVQNNVRLPLDALPSDMVLTKPSYDLVKYLRQYATTRVGRGQIH